MKKIITLLVVLLFFSNINISAYAEKNSVLELHRNILAHKNPSCRYIEVCEDLVKMDCNSALDGPLYYFNNTQGELLMVCGGACMSPRSNDPLRCKDCPLQAWQECKAKNTH